MKLKTICFDIDNVICKTNITRDYSKSIPLKKNIKVVNAAYEKGFNIILYTARYMGRCNGNLKKVVRGDKNFTGAAKSFLKQKSTKRALSYIKTMRDPKIVIKDKVRFYDKECIVCKMAFHPRQRVAKYCS